MRLQRCESPGSGTYGEFALQSVDSTRQGLLGERSDPCTSAQVGQDRHREKDLDTAARETEVFQSEMRAWEAARERWQQANPDVTLADYPAAAAEVAGVDATAAREILENATAADGVSAGEQQWTTDYAAVAQAEPAAQTASVLRRSAAQKDAEAARSRFQAIQQGGSNG
jgi:hypothetical protein